MNTTMPHSWFTKSLLRVANYDPGVNASSLTAADRNKLMTQGASILLVSLSLAVTIAFDLTYIFWPETQHRYAWALALSALLMPFTYVFEQMIVLSLNNGTSRLGFWSAIGARVLIAAIFAIASATTAMLSIEEASIKRELEKERIALLTAARKSAADANDLERTANTSAKAADAAHEAGAKIAQLPPAALALQNDANTQQARYSEILRENSAKITEQRRKMALLDPTASNFDADTKRGRDRISALKAEVKAQRTVADAAAAAFSEARADHVKTATQAKNEAEAIARAAHSNATTAEAATQADFQRSNAAVTDATKLDLSGRVRGLLLVVKNQPATLFFLGIFFTVLFLWDLSSMLFKATAKLSYATEEANRDKVAIAKSRFESDDAIAEMQTQSMLLDAQQKGLASYAANYGTTDAAEIKRTQAGALKSKAQIEAAYAPLHHWLEVDAKARAARAAQQTPQHEGSADFAHWQQAVDEVFAASAQRASAAAKAAS